MEVLGGRERGKGVGVRTWCGFVVWVGFHTHIVMHSNRQPHTHIPYTHPIHTHPHPHTSPTGGAPEGWPHLLGQIEVKPCRNRVQCL